VGKLSFKFYSIDGKIIWRSKKGVKVFLVCFSLKAVELQTLSLYNISNFIIPNLYNLGVR